jgi:hypothetical protein
LIIDVVAPKIIIRRKKKKKKKKKEETQYINKISQNLQLWEYI